MVALVGVVPTIAKGVKSVYDHKYEKKVIVTTILIVPLICAGFVTGAVFISKVTIAINGHTTVPIPGFPAATVPPTSTPSPTATPSPLPTPETITKNLDISCLCGDFVDIKLTTIDINAASQQSIWHFTLTDISNSPLEFSFVTLELEDGAGQWHHATGPASTDNWSLISGQSIPTYAIFDVVHGTNYLLYIVLSPLRNYQTETITF